MRLKEFRELVEQRTGKLIEQYVTRALTTHPSPEHKEFNDPVWGTITLSPLEVLYLDSPLVQRLRYIKQLGVVHWVYPGACHSRFEHTLGVMHQTEQLLRTFNDSPQLGLAHGGIAPEYAQLMRLAALHHDIGHGPFSHVSENAIVHVDTVGDILREFEHEQEIERAKLSEVIAHSVIVSRAFVSQTREFFSRVKNPPAITDEGGDPAELCCKKMAAAIVGKPVHKSIPLLHEVLNGPFDADKLDYMSRDARMTGVPITVDISRLIQKVTVKQFAVRELPLRIQRHLNEDSGPQYVLGLKWSGASVLDELCLGRTLLFSKVYRHQKVRAAEAMVEGFFHVLAQLLTPQQMLEAYISLTDDDILRLNADNFVAFMKRQKLDVKARKDSEAIEIAMSILARLRDRDHLVKSFVLQGTFQADPLGSDDEQLLGLKLLTARLSNVDHLKEFKRRIVDNVRALLRNLSPELDDLYSGERLASSIWVSRPNMPQGGSEISRAIVFPSAGLPITYDQANLNTDAWARAYNLSQAVQGFVFAPRKLSPYAYLATEKVLREDYNVIIPESLLHESKQNKKDINEHKVRAQSFNFYSGSPADLRPQPGILSRADIAGRIHAVSERFGIIQEVTDPNKAPSGLAMAVRVKNWLSQFQDASLIEAALVMLEKTKVPTRRDIVKALNDFIKDNEEFRDAIVCPVGSAKDSGAHISYYAQDLEEGVIRNVLHVEELARFRPTQPIIFYDDFLASGGQVENILGYWFEREDMKRDLGETRLPLETEAQKYIKNHKIAFVYFAAWDAGLRSLRDALTKLGINAPVFCSVSESELPFAFDSNTLGIAADVRDRLKTFCRDVGKDVLLSSEDYRKTMTPQKADSWALGHGNRAMLLVFPYNVPSQSLTVLRESGVFRGMPWSPLFKRRKKRSAEVG